MVERPRGGPAPHAETVVDRPRVEGERPPDVAPAPPRLDIDAAKGSVRFTPGVEGGEEDGYDVGEHLETHWTETPQLGGGLGETRAKTETKSSVELKKLMDTLGSLDSTKALDKIANPGLKEKFAELGTRLKDWYQNTTMWEKAKTLAGPGLGLLLGGLAGGPIGALVVALAIGGYKTAQSIGKISKEGNLSSVQRDRLARGLAKQSKQNPQEIRKLMDSIANAKEGKDRGKITLADLKSLLGGTPEANSPTNGTSNAAQATVRETSL